MKYSFLQIRMAIAMDRAGGHGSGLIAVAGSYRLGLGGLAQLVGGPRGLGRTEPR
jgi:hypothetical protein